MMSQIASSKKAMKQKYDRINLSVAVALVLATVLSGLAFMAADDSLLCLTIINLILIVHGMLNRGSIVGLIKFFSVQLILTLVLYWFIHGESKLVDGALVVFRIMLAVIPGWWLTVTCEPQRIGEVLAWIMPHKWAFVVSASISLLPFMGQEIKEIYQIQIMRGARISPKHLRNPKNWPELIYCVLLPTLIQLLKLSQQMATAATNRHFSQRTKPVYWRSP